MRTRHEENLGSSASAAAPTTSTSPIEAFTAHYNTAISNNRNTDYTLEFSKDCAEIIPLPEELGKDFLRVKSLMKKIYEEFHVTRPSELQKIKSFAESLEKYDGTTIKQDIIFVKEWPV